MILAASLLATGCFGAGDGAAGGRQDPDATAADGALEGSDAAATDAMQPVPAGDAALDAGHRGTRFEPQPPLCTDPDSRESRPERVRATTVGLTESLTDHCDADGNLIDHGCEILPSTDCAPCTGECSSCVEHTGRVVERPFDCNGGCVDGACVNWCPDPGDSLTVSHDAAAAALRVENVTKARSYLCTTHTDAQALCFDLSGYVAEQTYQSVTDCYGAVPGTLLLAWASAATAPTMCFVDCAQIVVP